MGLGNPSWFLSQVRWSLLRKVEPCESSGNAKLTAKFKRLECAPGVTAHGDDLTGAVVVLVHMQLGGCKLVAWYGQYLKHWAMPCV